MMMHSEVTIAMVNRAIEQIYRDSDDEPLDHDELEKLCLCWKIKKSMAKVRHMQEKPGVKLPGTVSAMMPQGVTHV